MTIERVKTIFGSIANKYPTYRDDDTVKAPSRYLHKTFDIKSSHVIKSK